MFRSPSSGPGGNYDVRRLSLGGTIIGWQPPDFRRASCYIITTTADLQIDSIERGSRDGQELVLFFEGSFDVALRSMTPAPGSGAQILMSATSEADALYALTPVSGIHFVYDQTLVRWRSIFPSALPNPS